MGQDADSSKRNWRGFAKTALPFALLAACLLSLDPLRVEEGTAGIARTFVMRVAAALYPAFPEKAPDDRPAVYARDAVTVVLIDDAYLAARKVSWPLSYRRQAALIDRIASFGPEAIFVDILYSEQHDRSMAGSGVDDAPKDLTDSLAHSNTPHIVFAAVADMPTPAGDCARAEARPPDEHWHDAQRARHLLLRDQEPAAGERREVFDPEKKFSLAYVNWSRCEGRYPLYFARDPRFTSPALALYRLYVDARRRDGGDVDALQVPQPGTAFGEPFVPRWGALPPAAQADFYRAGACQFDDDDPLLDSAGGVRAWLLRLRVLLQQLALSTMPARSLGGTLRYSQGVNAALPCPAVNVITASALAARDSGDPALASLLTGKFVLIGTDLEATGDVTVSPVHGELAGVLLHAMALDNLIRAPQSMWLQLAHAPSAWFDDVLPYVVLLVIAMLVYFQGARLESVITLVGGLIIVPSLTVLLVDNLGRFGNVTTHLGGAQFAVIVALILLSAALSIALWLKGWLAQATSLLLAVTFIPRLGGNGVLPLSFGVLACVLLFVVDPKILFRATCSFGLVLFLGVGLLLFGIEPFNVLTIGLAAIVVAERIHVANDPGSDEREQADRVRRLAFVRSLPRMLWARRPAGLARANASRPLAPSPSASASASASPPPTPSGLSTSSRSNAS